MENEFLFILLGIIGIYCYICYECSKVAERKGVKSSNAFLIAFFATPVAGFLYIICHLLPDVQEDGEAINAGEI